MRFSCFSSISLFVVVVATLLTLASSKELVLTKEWQTIGENETLPAGAHIRMDMTTGEKMAKLLDSDQPDKGAVEITPDGSALQILPDRDTKDAASDEIREKVKEARAKYDYDMMYRTLSKLPIDEQERMGLPTLPSSTGAEMSKEERETFQEKMKKLWEDRQQELARLQLEMQMDMPELLKDRIARLKAYLEDPSKHLMELEDARNTFDPEVEDGVVTDIESVLVDLEYHLADVDMTRDFHTLGGWHLLVSLLDDSVHKSNTNYSNTELVARVQMHAAWAIGTAVKNTEEFYSYGIEPLTVHGTTTTPLQLLKEQLDESPESKTCHKLVYALGSVLRGNRAAQLYFLRIDGPASLVRTLADTLRHGEDLGMAKRILALIGDVVSDVVLHADDHQNIIDAFATAQLCQSSLDSLKHAALRETSVRAILSIAPFCDWSKAVAITALEETTKSWQSEPGIDPQVRDELLHLVSTTIDAVMGKK
jgi:hypothetical protein